MILRYFPLFLGIVLLINGCNGLVSQNFGTHKLRDFTLAEATEGVGDADFVAVAGASYLAGAVVAGPALRATDKHYVLRPLVSPEQQEAHAAGRTVEVALVAWTETEDDACLTALECSLTWPEKLRGLVSEPTDKKNPVGEWAAQRVTLAERVTYLQLEEEPLAWYWNLGMLLGGVLLAVGSEAYWRGKAQSRS